MVRRYVGELQEQEAVDEVFRVTGKQLRPNRNGNLYLQMELSDRTGSIPTRMWNASEDVYRSFENGDYLRVEGTTQLFQGAMQLIATRVTLIEPCEVNEEEFLPLTEADIARLRARLTELLRGLDDPELAMLAECFLMDEEFMDKFTRAPAGIKLHHAYQGGLLEHVVNLMDVASRVAPCYPQIDRNLLVMGAFLHDMAKVDELVYDRDMAYSDEGQLIGHLVMAVGMLAAKVREAEKLSGEPLDGEKVLRLKHMIVAHHGQYEFGSPKLPMTLEALALYYLDNLDAKVFSFHQQLRDDPNVGSPWTHYNQNMGRKLFKGYGERD
ncbi:MAG: 3'-5' exoribonuclease YhaM family protein [Thermoguttaceae bacterium]|jgi:3'-5' exoribonuclease